MKIILKVLAVIVFFIIVIIIAGLIAAHFLINSSNIKKMLVKQFHQQTGRSLQIKQLSFSFLPTTQIEIQGATIDNAKGFGQTPFLTLKKVAAGVKILPLFHHKLVTTGVTISDLHLNLEVNKAGKSNWDDFLHLTHSAKPATQIAKQQAPIDNQRREQQQTKHQTSDSTQPFVYLAIPHVNLNDLSVNYTNKQNGESVSLQNLNLQANNIRNDQFFPFSLNVDYQKSNPQTQITLKATGQALFAPNYSLAKLKGVNFNSQITKEGSSQRFRFNNLNTTVKFPNNSIIINPLTAKLYSGQLSAQAKITSTSKNTRITSTGQLTGINLQPLLQDLTNQDKFAGHGNLTYQLSTQGLKGSEFIQHLNGSGSINLTQVQFKGFDLGYEYQNALNFLQHGKPLNKAHGNVTKFGHLNSRYQIVSGIIHLQKLKLTSPVLTIEASGKANLNNQRLNLRIQTTGMQGSLNNLRPYGPTIPFNVTGSFSHPKFAPDLNALAKSYLQDQAQKALSKLGKGKLNLDGLGKLFGH